MTLSKHSEIQIGPVAAVVGSQDIRLAGAIREPLGKVEHPVYGASHLDTRNVGQFPPSSDRAKMIETCSLDFLRLEKLKSTVRIAARIVGQRKAQTDLLTRMTAVPQTTHRLIKRPFYAAEGIVNFRDNVGQTDSHIRKSKPHKLLGGTSIDQCSVGGEHYSQTQLARVGGYIVEIRSCQGLSAGKNHRVNAKAIKVVQNGEAFLGRQLPGVRPIPRVRITPDAVEIAGSCQVPDHHETARQRAPGRSHTLVDRRVEFRDSAPVLVWRTSGYQSAVEDADIKH